MKKRKRKLKVKNLIIMLSIILVLLGIIAALVFFLVSSTKDTKVSFSADDLSINELDYSEVEEFDFELSSTKYMLVRLNDFKVLYGKDIEDPFYPASLAKVMTLNATLNLTDDYDEVSSYTREQYNELIRENASVAGLLNYKEYSIRDLMYALILPSGADAAVALENYADTKGVNLVDLMNQRADELGLEKSHFANTTGLHSNSLYVTMKDYAKIVIDTLLNKEGKEVLKASEYEIDDPYASSYMVSNPMLSSLYSLTLRDDGVKVYGGKTGYTPEAGLNICVLYEAQNRSYLLILANASGTYGEHNNINDVNTILSKLYN